MNTALIKSIKLDSEEQLQTLTTTMSEAALEIDNDINSVPDKKIAVLEQAARAELMPVHPERLRGMIENTAKGCRWDRRTVRRCLPTTTPPAGCCTSPL